MVLGTTDQRWGLPIEVLAGRERSSAVVFRLAAVIAVVVGWLAALLNQFRSASLVQADRLVLLPQGATALIVLAVVAGVAAAVVLLADRLESTKRRVLAGAGPRLLLMLAALVCGYLSTNVFARASEDDLAARAGLPLVLLLPTASRSLITAAVILLLAGLVPWRVVRAVLVALGGLVLLTLSTPQGATDWLAPFPLSLLVASLVLALGAHGEPLPVAVGGRSATPRKTADS